MIVSTTPGTSAMALDAREREMCQLDNNIPAYGSQLIPQAWFRAGSL
jgi:hypothetical protein